MINGRNHSDIEQRKFVDVEIGPNGDVVAVYYRGELLPFDTHYVSARRQFVMEDLYARHRFPTFVLAKTGFFEYGKSEQYLDHFSALCRFGVYARPKSEERKQPNG